MENMVNIGQKLVYHYQTKKEYLDIKSKLENKLTLA